MPPSALPAGAQGGTSARSTGAALSFVSCIRLLGGMLHRLDFEHDDRMLPEGINTERV